MKWPRKGIFEHAGISLADEGLGLLISGVEFSRKICGVSIIRSGEAMENALRTCCSGVPCPYCILVWILKAMLLVRSLPFLWAVACCNESLGFLPLGVKYRWDATWPALDLLPRRFRCCLHGPRWRSGKSWLIKLAKRGALFSQPVFEFFLLGYSWRQETSRSHKFWSKEPFNVPLICSHSLYDSTLLPLCYSLLFSNE